MEEEEEDLQNMLELGGPTKTQSRKEQELESGICVGIGSERELDSDFNLSSSWQQNAMMDL